MRRISLATMAFMAAGSCWAQEAPVGDAAAGEEHFSRQCIACHVVQDASGEVLAGRNAKVGPNLYGVVGRVAGSVEDYDYSELMETYGATGAVWGQENFVSYVQDPTGFLREATGEASGRSKMAYQVRDEQQAHDLYAYLATFSPAGEAPAEGEAAAAESEAAAE